MPFGTINHGRQIARERRMKWLPHKVLTFVAHTILTGLLILGFMAFGGVVALSMLG